MVLQPCVECGELSQKNRCFAHRLKSAPKDREAHAAYANRSKWRRMSRKLRKQSPHCELCGTSDDLTVDHIVRVTDKPEWTYEEDNCRILCRYHNGKLASTPATPQQEQDIAKKIEVRRERRLRLRQQLNEPPL